MANFNDAANRISMKEHKIKVWSLNVRGTGAVQTELLRLASLHQIDVVAVQDIASNTGQPDQVTDRSTISFESSATKIRKATSGNTFKPSISCLGYHLAFEHILSNRVCIYVRKDLDIKAWTSTCHDDMIATLTIETAIDTLHIHNVYNVAKRIPVRQLVDLVANKGQHLLLGDLNLHHPWWGGQRAWDKRCGKSTELYEAFKYEQPMVLLTEQGARTWEKSRNLDSTWSTLDLAFASPDLSKRAASRVCYDIPVRSDHFLVEVELDVSPDRVIFERRDWENANEQRLRNLAREGLRQTRDPVADPAELDAWLDSFTRVLAEVESHVPKIESAGHSVKMPPNVQRAFAHAKRCLRDYKAFRTRHRLKRLQNADAFAKELWKLEREQAWYNHMARSTADLQGAYKKYHWALGRDSAREPAHMPPLLDGEAPDLVTLTSPQSQSDCLAKSLLLVSADPNEEFSAPDLPFDVNPNSLPTCELLQHNDVDDLIQKMPLVRATVDNGVSNRILKICREVVVPHLLKFCE